MRLRAYNSVSALSLCFLSVERINLSFKRKLVKKLEELEISTVGGETPFFKTGGALQNFSA